MLTMKPSQCSLAVYVVCRSVCVACPAYFLHVSSLCTLCKCDALSAYSVPMNTIYLPRPCYDEQLVLYLCLDIVCFTQFHTSVTKSKKVDKNTERYCVRPWLDCPSKLVYKTVKPCTNMVVLRVFCSVLFCGQISYKLCNTIAFIANCIEIILCCDSFFNGSVFTLYRTGNISDLVFSVIKLCC